MTCCFTLGSPNSASSVFKKVVSLCLTDGVSPIEKTVPCRVRQIFFTKLVPGQVACKSHLPRRIRWLSHVTDGTSAAEIILHHLVVINKDI